MDKRLISDWVLAGVSGAANPLWMTEWLYEALKLQPGMRVLDLGCGRALSSIFCGANSACRCGPRTCGLTKGTDLFSRK